MQVMKGVGVKTLLENFIQLDDGTWETFVQKPVIEDPTENPPLLL